MRGERVSGGGLVSGNDKDKRRQHNRRGETSEGEKRTVRPSVDRRRWEEARFIESRGPIVKLLAILRSKTRVSNSNIVRVLQRESLSKSVYINCIAMVNKREKGE